MFCLGGQIDTNAAKQHQQTRLVCLTTETSDWLHFFWLDTAVGDGSFLLHFLPNKNTLKTGSNAIFSHSGFTHKKTRGCAGLQVLTRVQWHSRIFTASWPELCSDHGLLRTGASVEVSLEPPVKLQAAVSHAFRSFHSPPSVTLSFCSSSELHEHRGTGHEGLNYQQGDNLAVNLELLGRHSQTCTTISMFFVLPILQRKIPKLQTVDRKTATI